MPKLEAIVAMPFGVGVKQVGEQFDATQQEANLLVALKRAKLVKSEAAKAEPTKAEAPKVEKVVKAEEAPKPNASKRAYNRRDMKAKG